MPFSNPITGGQGALVRPAIKSPNYVAGTAGWSINRDGSAEFTDLLITFIVAGGKLEISDGELRLYNSSNVLVAEITPAGGADNLPGFLAYAASGVRYYSQLSEGRIEFGVDGETPDSSGAITYARTAGPADPATLEFSTGTIATAEAALVKMSSEDSSPVARPKVVIDGSGLALGNGCDLQIPRGSVSANNVRHGTAQTPAPGVGGGTSTVAVTFSPAMPATPRIVITAASAADPATVTILGYVDADSTTGFTIRAYRSTNAATNWRWHALSD